MRFFSKRVSALLPGDIDDLWRHQVSESIDVEFKRTLQTRDGADDRWIAQGDAVGDIAKKEIVKEVVGLANTLGGTFVLGVEQAKGNPPVATGIHCIPRVGELADRLQRVLREQIEPRLHHVEVGSVAIQEDGSGVVVIRVPGRSAFAPHRSRYDQHCYARRNNECVAMDMHEIQRMSGEISRQADSFDEIFNEEFKKLDALNDSALLLGARRRFAIQVVGVPLVKLFIPEIVTVLPLKAQFIRDCLAATIPGGEPRLTWRPSVRGVRGESGKERVHLSVDVRDGGIVTVRMIVNLRDESRETLDIRWIMGGLVNSILFVERARLAARVASAPYVLQVQGFSIPRSFKLSKFGEDWRYGSSVGKFPSLPVIPLDARESFEGVAHLVAQDIYHSAGETYDGCCVKFEFASAVGNIDREFGNFIDRSV